MRGVIILCLIVISGGCTTLQTIEGSPTELRQHIGSGERLKPGDRILVVTIDGETHQLPVTGVDAGVIEGKPESVPIGQLVFLEKRQVSPGKNLALVGGLAAAALLGVAIHAGTHPNVSY
jgi:hypothetical protein